MSVIDMATYGFVAALTLAFLAVVAGVMFKR
jgi:hypothetical protein